LSLGTNEFSGVSGVFFRDLLLWTDSLWDNANEQLQLISEAIETGKFNAKRSQKLNQEFHRTARDGPWSASSGKDATKQWAEGIPIIGKLLSALW
jgi:hypothetical protein